MKRRYIIALTVALITAAVLIVLNPLGLANPLIPDNTTDGNHSNGQPPDTRTWIGPGKVFVAAYSPGKTVTYYVQVHNGNNYSATFSVDYRTPDSVLEGYARPTQQVRDWIGIDQKRVTIGAYKTANVTIRIGMPSTSLAPASKWEFWIGVIDQSQTGMIQTELCQRCLVTMSEGTPTVTYV